MAHGSPAGGLLARLGMHRPELRGWAFYDWAKSSFETTIGAAVFPVFYATVAGASLAPNVASAYLGYTNSIALLIVAVIAPVLGASADFLGAKKRFLAAFMLVGALAAAGMFFIDTGEWTLASTLFIIGAVGVTGSTVFNDSLLPHIASDDEVDRVSSAAYAMGYFGGGILLAINVVMILRPGLFGFADAGVATRATFVTVSVWWLLFSIPMFLRVPEPPRAVRPGEAVGGAALTAGLARLRATLREIRDYRETVKFLLAYWLYIDGVHTIQKLAAVYGAELGIDRGTLIGAILLVQFVGIPFTFLFGALGSRIGARRGIYIGLVAYMLIATAGFFIREAWHFWALAVAVGMVQGGVQALSRSLYATLVPQTQSSEFFSFFGISERFGGVLGPAVFGLVATLTGTSRFGVLAMLAFFVSGLLFLTRVDIEAGRRAARAEDAGAVPLPAGADSA